MSSQQVLDEIISKLHWQYPWSAVTTNSACPRCGAQSRGGELCSNCLTMDLSELVGETLAHEYQRQVALLRQLYWQMSDAAQDRIGGEIDV